MKIPEVNKEYWYFDDGKVRESRLDYAHILEVIPFKEVDKEIFEFWKEESNLYNYLYDKTTDFFVKAHLKDDNRDVIFVRARSGGWFSLGVFAGRLDIDGSLYNSLRR